MATLLLNKAVKPFLGRGMFEMTASRTFRSMDEVTSRITCLRALIVSGFTLKILKKIIQRERSGDLAGHGMSDRCEIMLFPKRFLRQTPAYKNM